MNQTDLLKILEAVESGKLSPGAALERLRHLPFEDLGFAKVDHHRALRQGFAEVVFAKGKTPQQVAEIVRAMLQKKDSRHNILVTRASPEVFSAVKKTNGKTARAARFHPLSGVITIERSRETSGKGVILVVSAGTSDIPVAEEAFLTAHMMGNRVDQLYDVGVAGIHRLLEHRESKLAQARVIICVAGMEGALPRHVFLHAPEQHLHHARSLGKRYRFLRFRQRKRSRNKRSGIHFPRTQQGHRLVEGSAPRTYDVDFLHHDRPRCHWRRAMKRRFQHQRPARLGHLLRQYEPAWRTCRFDQQRITFSYALPVARIPANSLCRHSRTPPDRLLISVLA